jgi:hypothetical protein
MLTTVSCWFFSMLTVYQPYGCHFKCRERHFSLCFYLRDVVSESRRRREGLWSFFWMTLEFFFHVVFCFLKWCILQLHKAAQ